MDICTIIARNYLPGARVLAKSFLEHHPEGRVSVLILDDPRGEVSDHKEPFRIVRLEDLNEPIEELQRMAVLYDIMELATSVKPWLVEYLLDSGATEVIYLDPDIQVFQRLDDLASMACDHGIVLNPHFTDPVPRDGLKTDETSILAAGIYNLGFIALGQDSRQFLQFWKERLRRECRLDPVNMRFVDQRWIDFVPGMFDHVICRDPTINVAYWNLHHRVLKWTGERYEVDGNPLRFYHFSGYSPRLPHLLSKHQGDRPRIRLSEHPDLAKLCNQYGELLLANGYETEHNREYGLSRMANGVPIDENVRRLFRLKLTRAEQAGRELPPNPFDPAGADELVAWLNTAGPAERGPERLTLYQATLYAHDPTLQRRFADPQGADYDAFQRWFDEEVSAGKHHPLLVPPQSLAAADLSMGAEVRWSMPDESSVTVAAKRGWPPPEQLRPGINIVGYLQAELGIGEAARLMVGVLEAADIPFAALSYDRTASRQSYPFSNHGARLAHFDTNLVVVNADETGRFADTVGPEFFQGRHTIGNWAWELEEFPRQYWHAFDLVQEVWVCSSFTQRAIQAATDKPVFAFPHPVVVPPASPELDRSFLGLGEAFTFLFCFDLFSSLDRKNPIGLIDAFCHAFEPNEGPELVIKAVNGARRMEDLERLRWAARSRSDVKIIDQYFDHDENAALMAAADCYVSLHRSEGFGLTMAEAMALGKPVIATAYSGNMDFMTPDNAYLVPWSYTVVPHGADPYPPGIRWAEPDLDQAAAFMRQVVQNPDEAMEIGRRGRDWVLTHHGPEQRVAFVRERFESVHRTSSEAGRATAVSEISADQTQEQPSRDPQRVMKIAQMRREAVGSSRFGRAGRFFWKLVNRVLRGHLEIQRRIDVELAQEIERLENLIAGSVKQESSFMSRTATTFQAQARRLNEIQGLTKPLRNSNPDGPSLADLQKAFEQLHAIPYMSDPSVFSTVDTRGRPAIGYRETIDSQRDEYASFEDVFRGTETTVKELLDEYVALLQTAGPVLDIGCGRGEMLDLLSEAGVPAHGIDLDDSMVRRAREKGHTVRIGDAVKYLQDQVDESLGAVFSAQVVEHMPPHSLQELIRQSYRVLRPEGLLIMETVNPHAIHALKTFWVDLTHRVPIFPEVLVALCRGIFEEAVVRFPGGTGILDLDRAAVGQYAVVARKKPI